MRILRVLSIAVVLVIVTVSAAQNKYETGTLVDITHQDSSRIVGNPGNGSVVSVTDREYDISIKVGTMTYVGSYWPRWRWSYEPTDFVINSEVKVRLTKNKLFILRNNGKELETKFIKRVTEKSQGEN